MSEEKQKGSIITRTDCRSDEGKVVGLIDAAIGIFNVLPDCDLSGNEVGEAINDLLSTEFYYYLKQVEKQQHQMLRKQIGLSDE